ncbi:MAG: alpha/beta fold hydrolase [Rickettsiales bacterium]|nr:alpha/beta fold hydrolase [Rickettsiales bacterium]
MPGFIFRSTGIVINLLEKVINSNLSVKGLENIPDGPVLFVANHFTRSETFILPYMIFKNCNRRVRTLASQKLFVGGLGRYLTSMGTVATSNKHKSEIITGDLLTGRYDWLIYPEGRMIKNKHITSKKKYIFTLDGKIETVKTGSAVLAIKNELIKKDFVKAQRLENYEFIDEIRKKYFLEKDEVITPKPLYIVPISINYFPIRPGNNPVLRLSKKFLDKLPDRVLEELEIEGNLIFNSEITLNFAKPINVYEYIKGHRHLFHKIPIISHETRNDIVIKYFRYRLTNYFMREIYNNTFINIDHIFAAILDNLELKMISKDHLKTLIYVIAQEIRSKTTQQLHKSIANDINKIFFDDDNKYLKSVTSLALNQGLINIKNDIYYLNHEVIDRDISFHKLRISNTLRILMNEISRFKNVKKIITDNCNQPYEKIANKAFNILIKTDQKIYFSDYKKYFDAEYSKDREMAKPFYLEGNNDVGVILSHGYKSSPEEVRALAKYLNKLGYHIYAPRLKGHGTSPINLKYTEWEEWYESYYIGYLTLKQKCKRIVAAGFSTGGLLALKLASDKTTKISAIISINSALRLNDIKVNLVPTVHFWNELIDKFDTDKGKKEFIIDTPENAHINYSKNYLKGVYELSQLMESCEESLKKIVSPILIIQGDKDPVVNPKSGKLIYKKTASLDKDLLMLDFDKHVIITNKRRDIVFNHISEYLQNILQKHPK